ncbi:probable receptor-like protein kinase At1g49730 isoform X2 [Dendrobium catenatum]|uniref:probable receptor-like protein kinase At1g49730 isoform X2 n=1 Tax=Dendrobium catenatum TaxID=906689 RepID=UPI00109FE01F|nr:probable receptor-like protein kinase At1g49730 isoform X2 [Dendrobium catenatum]
MHVRRPVESEQNLIPLASPRLRAASESVKKKAEGPLLYLSLSFSLFVAVMPVPALILVVLAAVASFLESSRLLVVADDCPLDMTWSNFTWAASACSSQNERAKCCRYLNAFVTVSVARYANTTGNFGVPSALNDVCLNYVTQTFLSYGIPHNATLFCGIGPKIHVSYQCQGITSGSEFLQTPNFEDVIRNCKMPLSIENSCRRCVNSSIIFLHHLIGALDNVTLNTCRDAAFVALANQGDNASAIDLASCFFSIKELQILPGSSIICQRFRYNEIKKATNNFSNIIGRGGFGTVYKAQFAYGTSAAVKRMNPVAEHHKRVFCREMELHSRLHHRHLVAFRGFCVERCERFLVYEYMENGSLKDYLHSSEKTPLTWEIRIQIAIDVANALEYLHFYCDPPLCHRDIKSSNILLDKNFLAKVADFGLAHASTRDESVTASVKLYIHGTPGYVDPEYVVTRQLTEKSDVYSYGMLLLELVTGRHAIQDNRNLIEWSQQFIETNSKLFGLVDPKLGNSFDEEQLQVVIRIAKWCTHREGSARPSMKQVLKLLYESLSPIHGGLVEAMEDEGRFSVRKSGKGINEEDEVVPYSDDGGICLQSSSSTTTRSFCSRSVLFDCGSPQSPSGITST